MCVSEVWDWFQIKMIGGSVDVDVPCSLNIHSFSGTVGAKEILYQVGKTTYLNSWEHFWKKGMKLDKIKNSFFENCVRSKTKYNYEKYYRGLHTLNEILFDIISRLILENSNTFFKQILMKNGKTHQQTYHIKTYQLESYWTFKNFIIKVIRRINFSPHPILNSKMAFLCSVVQFC